MAAAAVVADFRADHGPALDRLLDRLEESARERRFGSVISFPFALVDLVTGRTSHERVSYLCEASEVDRVMEIALACTKPPAQLHDIGKKQGPARLQQLSGEVGRIATILANLSEDELLNEPPAQEEGHEGEISASAVRAIIRARRLRDQYFANELFADLSGTCRST